MDYKLKFKTQNMAYGGYGYTFSPISRESFKTCSYCKTFPYCVILQNSGYRYKNCPCHQCFVKALCHKQCSKFQVEINSLFGFSLSTDYKDYWYNLIEKK